MDRKAVLQIQRRRRWGAFYKLCYRNLLGLIGNSAKPLAELVDPATDVHHPLLAGEERMALAGHVDLVERIFLAVGPGDVLLGLNVRPGQQGEVGRKVLE